MTKPLALTIATDQGVRVLFGADVLAWGERRGEARGEGEAGANEEKAEGCAVPRQDSERSEKRRQVQEGQRPGAEVDMEIVSVVRALAVALVEP